MKPEHDHGARMGAAASPVDPRDLRRIVEQRDAQRRAASELLGRLRADRGLDTDLANAYRLHLYHADRLDAKLRASPGGPSRRLDAVGRPRARPRSPRAFRGGHGELLGLASRQVALALRGTQRTPNRCSNTC